MKKIRIIGALCLAVLWVGLSAFAWLRAPGEISEAERRPLAQFPELNAETLLNTKFMSEFEDYTLDQFPLRDAFRQVKSLFHYYVMGQKDNNDIYIADGYAAKLEYPLNEAAVKKALEKFNLIYENNLKDSGSKIYTTIIPDKGYYLGEANGYPVMDYEKLYALVQAEMPWSTHVDIRDQLSAKDYYFTDTHWRQENLLPVAGVISEAMGVTAPKAEDFTKTKVEKPFYGVYYGQAALPMAAEDLLVMESDILKGCTVYSYDLKADTAVYNMDKITSRDLYDVFLSGPQSLLEIHNPNAKTDRELVVFRDSFGSSLVPLLVQDYAKVTVVDIRYLPSSAVGQFVEFAGQDVLFAYSTLILNTGSALK